MRRAACAAILLFLLCGCTVPNGGTAAPSVDPAPSVESTPPAESPAPPESDPVADKYESRYRYPLVHLGATMGALRRKPMGIYEWDNYGHEAFSTDGVSHCLFSGSMREDASRCVAASFLARDTLEELTADFGAALRYGTDTRRGLPYCEAAVGEVTFRFYLNNEQTALWEPKYGSTANAVMFLPSADVEDYGGTLGIYDTDSIDLPMEARDDAHWEPVNAQIDALGMPMDDLRAGFPRTRPVERLYYQNCFENLDTGFIYRGDAVCDFVEIPVGTVFPGYPDGVTQPQLEGWLAESGYGAYTWSDYEDLMGYSLYFNDNISLMIPSDIDKTIPRDGYVMLRLTDPYRLRVIDFAGGGHWQDSWAYIGRIGKTVAEIGALPGSSPYTEWAYGDHYDYGYIWFRDPADGMVYFISPYDDVTGEWRNESEALDDGQICYGIGTTLDVLFPNLAQEFLSGDYGSYVAHVLGLDFEWQDPELFGTENCFAASAPASGLNIQIFGRDGTITPDSGVIVWHWEVP